jgi:catechol 2,3-dioxygenase-like lactoylglutathione lyase family enzyme
MTSFTFAATAFPVADVGATARWYRDVLGFQFNTFPATEPFEWASVHRDQVEIMLQRVIDYEKPDLDPRRPGGVWNAYFYVTDVDNLFASVKDRAVVRRAPCDQPYHLREFEIADPNGYVLVFGQNIRGAGSAK